MKCQVSASAAALDARFARVSIAPFDRPVVPDVYTIAASDCGPSPRGTAGIAVDLAHERGQRSFALRSQGLHGDSGALRQRFEHCLVGGADDGDPGMRVAQEVIDFVRRVRHVDGHEYRAHAQTGGIQEYGVHGFIHVHRDAVPRHDAQPQQGRGETPGLAVQRCVAQFRARGSPEKYPLRVIAGGGFNPIGGICIGRHEGRRD